MLLTTHPIASEIARVRRALGLTLWQFAEKTGIPWQSLAHYESGRAMPPADRLLVIAHAARRVPFRTAHVTRRVARARRGELAAARADVTLVESTRAKTD